MKAIQLHKPGAMRLVELPNPEPPPGWACIRVKAAAICMTDLQVLRGTIAALYPLVPGHGMEWRRRASG